MEIAIALIVGVLAVLTVENTIALHKKPKADEPRDLTQEEKDKAKAEKQDAEDWEKVMKYHGRDK